MKMTSTSNVNQFGSMDGFRAFYLAESGGQYAIPVINNNIDDPDTIIPLLDGRTFTFANEVEKVHAKLYQKALDNLENMESVDYYVCSVCGFTCESEQPDACTVCGAKAKAFSKTE